MLFRLLEMIHQGDGLLPIVLLMANANTSQNG